MIKKVKKTVINFQLRSRWKLITFKLPNTQYKKKPAMGKNDTKIICAKYMYKFRYENCVWRYGGNYRNVTADISGLYCCT